MHDYYILDNLNFPLFSKDWAAKDELLLIQGIMKCGMGNWIDIAEQYVKNKEPKECDEHYFSYYYKLRDDVVPKQDEFIIKAPRVIKNGNIALEIDEMKVENSLRKLKEY